MKDFARSFAPAPLQFAGRRYRVRPPTVGEAARILAIADADLARWANRQQLRGALREWWPPTLASAATSGAGWVPQALALARDILLLRTKADREAVASSRGADSPEDIDWVALASDYMAVNGLSRREVRAELWPEFLQAAAHLRRPLARWGLMYQRAKGIPYIEEDTEREAAMDGLRREAGRPTSAEIREAQQPQTVEEQRAALESL